MSPVYLYPAAVDAAIEAELTTAELALADHSTVPAVPLLFSLTQALRDQVTALRGARA